MKRIKSDTLNEPLHLLSIPTSLLLLVIIVHALN